MKFFSCYLLCFLFFYADAQKINSFKIVPLGVYGGSDESNLSSYMIGVNGTNNFVCFDAGTLHDGIEKAIHQKVFTYDASTVLKKDIKGYLISHPHLDHVAGMIINSPDDSAKNIYALPFCIDVLENNYFTWKSWANFGDEGDKPALKKYHYNILSLDSETSLSNTNMFVKVFELSHATPSKSSAFLVRKDSSFVLYLGDTGADSIEKSNKLSELWKYIAPLITTNKLKGIFIETSFPDEQPVNKLFGHLTPSLFYYEMNTLATFCGLKNLQKVPIAITHIKPNANNETLIKKELKNLNHLHLQLIFPIQGKSFLL